MNSLSWSATIKLVHQRANFLCEYCQTSQRTIGQAMHVEHINPDGGDEITNLCLSCSSCNLSKALATSAIDPETGLIFPLFNPRTQIWADHFAWSEEGEIVLGLTPIGRATIIRLKMNLQRLIDARLIWISAGVHPP